MKDFSDLKAMWNKIENWDGRRSEKNRFIDTFVKAKKEALIVSNIREYLSLRTENGRFFILILNDNFDVIRAEFEIDEAKYKKILSFI